MKLFLLSLLLLFSFSIAETYFPEINIPLVKQSFVLNVNHRLSDDSYVPLGTISVDLDIKKQKGWCYPLAWQFPTLQEAEFRPTKLPSLAASSPKRNGKAS